NDVEIESDAKKIELYAQVEIGKERSYQRAGDGLGAGGLERAGGNVIGGELQDDRHRLAGGEPGRAGDAEQRRIEQFDRIGRRQRAEAVGLGVFMAPMAAVRMPGTTAMRAVPWGKSGLGQVASRTRAWAWATSSQMGRLTTPPLTTDPARTLTARRRRSWEVRTMVPPGPRA